MTCSSTPSSRREQAATARACRGAGRQGPAACGPRCSFELVRDNDRIHKRRDTRHLDRLNPAQRAVFELTDYLGRCVDKGSGENSLRLEVHLVSSTFSVCALEWVDPVQLPKAREVGVVRADGDAVLYRECCELGVGH
jgi:hypothetical protein